MRTSPEAFFPPFEFVDRHGVLCAGGELSEEYILYAYRRGIFPWPWTREGEEALYWWWPQPRAIIEFDDFHVSHRLARRIRSGRFTTTFNQAFRQVITACAPPRKPGGGMWITPDLIDAYTLLHEKGICHSVETWRDGELAGGVYGLGIGAYFSAESMFHRQTDASKVALYHLVERLKAGGFQLLDIQELTNHTKSLGGKHISRDDFMERLEAAQKMSAQFTAPQSDG